MLSNYFGSLEVKLLLSLLLSLLSGFAIGAERESRHKDAGISTHTFVIAGSMIFSFISGMVDPESTSRIASQIVTGIGFLGAGLILKEGTNVRNLTTAASLWYAGAIGMAYGFGYYAIGLLATFAAIIIVKVPHLNASSPEAVQHNKKDN